MTKLPSNTLHELPMIHLQASKTNPRKFFDKAELADLATSIKEKGVLEPLLVRIQAGTVNSYEIVAGERRFRASDLAKLETVPCIIRDLTDQQVAEIQVVENMQRQDLTPAEEAQGYKLLHEKYKYSWEDLAAKIGKSQSYIYARLRLLQLAPKILKLLKEGKLQLSFAVELQRIESHQDQLKVLENVPFEGNNYPNLDTVKELRDHINEKYMLQLAEAPFDTKDNLLLIKAGACTTCPKRTGAQESLFGDAGKKDSCLDSACWGLKLKGHQAAVTAKMKEKGQDVVQLKKGEKFQPERRGLVKLVDKDCDLKGNTSWKAALTTAKAMDKISPIAIMDGAGNTELYAHKKEIIAALPKSAWSYAPPSARDVDRDAPKTLVGPARIKRLVDLASVREAWPATWPKVINALQDVPLTGDTLRTLVNVVIHHIVRFPTDNEIKDRTGSKIESQLSAAKTDKDLRRLIWNVALGVGLYPGNTKLTDAGVKVFARARVDWTAALGQVVTRKMAERKAKADGKKATSGARMVHDKDFDKAKSKKKKIDKIYANVVAKPTDVKKAKPKKKGGK